MSISIVRQNAEKDPNYCPYCMNCKGNVRMRQKADFLWSCKCGAVHDERWSLEKCNEELGAACHYSCHTDVNEAREAVSLMMKEFKK